MTIENKIENRNKILEVFEKNGFKDNQEYTQAMAEELFMKVLYDEKLGSGSAISLYRKDGQEWGKLVKNGNTIVKEPCLN